ncbi:response regulator transcription factor [Paraburkholderia pallida]|uniref:Response regulator transcription factor n=1 Tax=Paraburkholderia pallida TaxID=2547399 RepID=A0A4P7D0E1_9BURK|nr:response regulator [Paraburkholderia pallida]QBR02096.1 response regulator transcription factor [Paraburkholderia pallida]
MDTVPNDARPAAAGPIAYVIDDDESQRKALSSLLRSTGMRAEVFGSCDEFLRFERPEVPSCLVLDVRLQGYSGLVFQDQQAHRHNPIPIVFITAHGDVWMCAKAMKSGAVDFLTKPLRDQEVLDAVALGIERDSERRRSLAAHADLQQRYATLTPREREVMSHVLRGSLNKQIAADLALSEVTVKMHRGQVMHKMGSRSVADLVQKAGLLGLARFQPDPAR